MPIANQEESIHNQYEKQIYDLKQLLEISKSLNSTLNYNILIDSILFTCMGQMQVLKIGIFTKNSIDHNYFSLHRNYKGFEIENHDTCIIKDNTSLTALFSKNQKCYTMPELLEEIDAVSEIKVFTYLEPTLIVPLIAKGKVNGIIFLGDRIDGGVFQEDEKEFLLNIALFAAIAIQNAFLFELTTTDMMTKLKLRHFFFTSLMEQMGKADKNNFALSVIMLDIDHFKKLNDTYGHPFGDTVLKKISLIIRENVRKIDIAARYGGEEMIILLPKVDKQEALLVAERIRQAVAEELFKFGDVEVHSTISLGVAQFIPGVDTTTEQFIKRVDAALYASKDNGRNRTTLAE